MALLISCVLNEEAQEMRAPHDERAISRCVRVGVGKENQVQGSEDTYRTVHWFQPNGSSWWGLNPQDFNIDPNPKAMHLFNTQAKGTIMPSMYGHILYLSPDETKVLMRFRSIMVPVFGKTFNVKDQIKALGGWWDAIARVWLVPVGKYDMAETLVRNGA